MQQTSPSLKTQGKTSAETTQLVLDQTERSTRQIETNLSTFPSNPTTECRTESVYPASPTLKRLGVFNIKYLKRHEDNLIRKHYFKKRAFLAGLVLPCKFDRFEFVIITKRRSQIPTLKLRLGYSNSRYFKLLKILRSVRK